MNIALSKFCYQSFTFLLENHTLRHSLFLMKTTLHLHQIITVLCCLVTVNFRFNAFYVGILLANSKHCFMENILKNIFIMCYLQAIMEKEQCGFLREGFIYSVILKLHQNNQHIPVPRQRHVDWSRTESVHWQCWYIVVQKNFFWNSQSQRCQEFQYSSHHHFHYKDEIYFSLLYLYFTLTTFISQKEIMGQICTPVTQDRFCWTRYLLKWQLLVRNTDKFRSIKRLLQCRPDILNNTTTKSTNKWIGDLQLYFYTNIYLEVIILKSWLQYSTERTCFFLFLL